MQKDQVLQVLVPNAYSLRKEVYRDQRAKTPLSSTWVLFDTCFATTIMDKRLETLAFLGRFPIHTGPTPPSPHKQFWTRLSRIFSEFQLCIGLGEGERQENFEKDALF